MRKCNSQLCPLSIPRRGKDENCTPKSSPNLAPEDWRHFCQVKVRPPHHGSLAPLRIESQQHRPLLSTGCASTKSTSNPFTKFLHNSNDMNIKVLLGLAFWAHSFSCADALRVVEKSPLDTIARELKYKPGKESSSSHGGADKEESSTSSTSKGGKNPPPPNSSKAHKESTPFFVTSASCPQECLSANYAPDSHLLMDAIEQCDAESYHQQWEFLKVGTFNMLKNVGASDESTVATL